MHVVKRKSHWNVVRYLHIISCYVLNLTLTHTSLLNVCSLLFVLKVLKIGLVAKVILKRQLMLEHCSFGEDEDVFLKLKLQTWFSLVFWVCLASLWSVISKQREMLNETQSSILTLLVSFIKICWHIRFVFNSKSRFLYAVWRQRNVCLHSHRKVKRLSRTPAKFSMSVFHKRFIIPIILTAPSY